MVKTKSVSALSCIFLLMLATAGCSFGKEKEQGNESVNSVQEDIGFEIQVPEEMPVSIQVEDGDVIDVDGLLEYFYGEKKETLMEAGYIEEYMHQGEPLVFDCDKDGIQLTYSYPSDSEDIGGRNSFTVCDSKEAAGMAYEQVLSGFNFQGAIPNRFKQLFPQIELDWCSREEAITACASLAKACGYEMAQVSVYTMTEDTLNKLADEKQKKTNGIYYLNAPSPDYDVIEWDIQRKGDAWTKQHEAYFVVYQTTINGLILDSCNYYLCCVYAPAYGRIVYAHADQSLRLVNLVETTPHAIQKESLLKSIQSYQKGETDSRTITNITMVYAPKYAKMNSYLNVRIIDPCWRIDYVVDESGKYNPGYESDDWTIIVNAVDGSVVKYGGNE